MSWHAQKRLFMNFRYKFRHRRSIRRPRFPVRVQNVGDLATFSVDFCILYAECPPYFYFRFVWPTDLESIPHPSTPTSIIPTKFEAPTPIRSWVMSYNLAGAPSEPYWAFTELPDPSLDAPPKTSALTLGHGSSRSRSLRTLHSTHCRLNHTQRIGMSNGELPLLLRLLTGIGSHGMPCRLQKNTKVNCFIGWSISRHHCISYMTQGC